MDVYDAYFQPFRHPATRFNIWGGHGFETFGADFLVVNNFARNFVWKVVDDGGGLDQWITHGLHYVMRGGVCPLERHAHALAVFEH